MAVGLAAGGDARACLALEDLECLWREVGHTEDEVGEEMKDLADALLGVFDAHLARVRRERDEVRESVAAAEVELERVHRRFGKERAAPPSKLGRMSLREYKRALGEQLGEAQARASACTEALRDLSERVVNAEAEAEAKTPWEGRDRDVAVASATQKLLANSAGREGMRLVLDEDDAAKCDLSGSLHRALEALLHQAEDARRRRGHKAVDAMLTTPPRFSWHATSPPPIPRTPLPPSHRQVMQEPRTVYSDETYDEHDPHRAAAEDSHRLGAVPASAPTGNRTSPADLGWTMAAGLQPDTGWVCVKPGTRRAVLLMTSDLRVLEEADLDTDT